MNALDLLKSDHEKVATLLDQLQQSDDIDQRREYFEMIQEELQVHTDIEEQIFYPEIRSREGFREMIEEFVDEHSEITDLLEEIDASDDENEFDDRIEELQEAVDHHVDEEENELFPRLRETMSEEELEDLGNRLWQAKQTPAKAA